MIRLMHMGIEVDIKEMEDINDMDHMKKDMNPENEAHARGGGLMVPQGCLEGYVCSCISRMLFYNHSEKCEGKPSYIFAENL